MPVATSSNPKSSSIGRRPKSPPHNYNKRNRNLSKSPGRLDEYCGYAIMPSDDSYIGHGIAMGASARQVGNHTRLCLLPVRRKMEEGRGWHPIARKKTFCITKQVNIPNPESGYAKRSSRIHGIIFLLVDRIYLWQEAAALQVCPTHIYTPL